MTIPQSPATDCETLHRDAYEKDRLRSLLAELFDRVAALEAAAAAPAPPPPAPDHLGDATDDGLLRCYAAAAGEVIAHRRAGLQEAREAGRRAIYDLGRRHGAAQAIQEAKPAAAKLEATDG